MLLYYITDRTQFPGNENDRRLALMQRIAEAASCDLDMILLCENDLGSRNLESLAREAAERIRISAHTKLLIHSRTDIALAVGADGVYLDPGDPSAGDVRSISSGIQDFMVGVACYSPSEVRLAESQGADFVTLSPIFERGEGDVALGVNALALAALRNVPPDRRVEAGDHRVGVPIVAMGGVTAQNASACMRAGASGIAATRLFQFGDLREIVSRLRADQV